MTQLLKDERGRHRTIIESWFNTICQDGGIDRYDDLHIDQIDKVWKSRSTWISAALWSFEVALDIRDAHSDDQHLKIALAFSLRAGEEPQGVTFNNRDGLAKNFDTTPPSLYVFRPEMEYWKNAKVYDGTADARYEHIKILNAAELFGEIGRPVECIFTEFEKAGEFVRSLFLVA